jgi:hypothetical protein
LPTKVAAIIRSSSIWNDAIEFLYPVIVVAEVSEGHEDDVWLVQEAGMMIRVQIRF